MTIVSPHDIESRLAEYGMDAKPKCTAEWIRFTKSLQTEISDLKSTIIDLRQERANDNAEAEDAMSAMEFSYRRLHGQFVAGIALAAFAGASLATAAIVVWMTVPAWWVR